MKIKEEMVSDLHLNIRMLEKLRWLVKTYVARPFPNPYQSEPYSFEIEEKIRCLALADEFEAAINNDIIRETD
jgi:hypothetical protein